MWQKFCFLPLVYFELWEWRRLQSGTREFYLRVVGASWVPSGGEGAPLGALWGWGSGVVKNFSPLKMSTFPPASISDLVSPGIVGCLGSVIWYPSSLWEKKNLQLRLSFSIPTFSNYLLSISPTRKQCPKNRCSDVGLETGLTSKMAPLGNFPHMKNVDIGLEIDPTHLKNLPHLKKKLTLPLVVWKPFGCQG